MIAANPWASWLPENEPSTTVQHLLLNLGSSNNAWLSRPFQIKPVSGSAMIEINGVRRLLTPGDVSFLFNLATQLPAAGNYLEVGSWMGLSSISRRVPAAESLFHHFDGRHNTAGLSDEVAAVAGEYQYDAFGKLLQGDPSATPHLYKGEVGYHHDADLDTGEGTYVAHHRVLSGGRFLSEDPAEDDPNTYRHVRNNPLNENDPSGLEESSTDQARIEWELAKARLAELEREHGPYSPSTLRRVPLNVRKEFWEAYEQVQDAFGRYIRTKQRGAGLGEPVASREHGSATDERGLGNSGEGTIVLRPRQGDRPAEFRIQDRQTIEEQRDGLLKIDPATGRPFGIQWPVEIFEVPPDGLPRQESNPIAESGWYVLVDDQPWELYKGDRQRLLESVDRGPVAGPLATIFGFQETFDDVRRDIENRARQYRVEYRLRESNENPLDLHRERSIIVHERMVNDFAPIDRALIGYGFAFGGIRVGATAAQSTGKAVARRAARRAASRRAKRSASSGVGTLGDKVDDLQNGPIPNGQSSTSPLPREGHSDFIGPPQAGQATGTSVSPNRTPFDKSFYDNQYSRFSKKSELVDADDFVRTDGVVLKAHPAKHSLPKSDQLDVLNNWERSWTGINYNGRPVDIYWKNNKAVITQRGAKNKIITAYDNVPHTRWSDRSNWRTEFVEEIYKAFMRNTQR